MSPVPASLGPCRTPISRSRTAHAALAHARSKGFPWHFLRQFSRSAYFNRATSIQRMDKRIRPTGADMVFDPRESLLFTQRAVCPVHGRLCRSFSSSRDLHGETACLSTQSMLSIASIDFHILADASASHQLGELSAADVKRRWPHCRGLRRNRHTSSWIARARPIRVC